MSLTPDFTKPADLLTFTPLQTSSTIRILKLLPGSLGHPIKCTMHHTTIDSDDYAYHALSYTWGDTTSMRTIECNGAKALVSRNLHCALSRLRHPSEELCLWVDALCINQSTKSHALRERGRQVQMMNEIFSRAKLVFVDLGNADDDEVASLLHFLSKFEEAPNPNLRQEYKDVLTHLDLDLPTLDHPGWSFYGTLMVRPWFQRVWIIQEFILAKELIILVGKHRLPSRFLTHVVPKVGLYYIQMRGFSERWETVHNKLERLRPILYPIRNLGFISCTRRTRTNGIENGQLFFRYFLQHSRYFDATDKRDRVYALLGLSTDISRVSLPVDYSKPLHEVSRRLSRLMIENGDGRYVICHCVGLIENYPSWAIDLNFDKDSPYRGIFSTAVLGAERGEFYSASGDSASEMHINSDESSLTATASMLGCIVSLAGREDISLTAHDTAEDTPRELLGKFILSVIDWISQLQGLGARAPDSKDVWKTAFADTTYETAISFRRCGKHPGFQSAYESFLKIISYVNGDSKLTEEVDCVSIKREAAPCFNTLASIPNKQLGFTDTSLLCMVPKDTQIGDQLSIFLGVPLPFVLRKDTEHFRIVGPCYIHNMMDGQVFETGKWRAESIEIR